MRPVFQWRNKAIPASYRGLTLIEVLCLLALLLLAFWIVKPKIGHGPARTTAAMTQIADFKVQLGAFRDDNGFYPTTRDGLQALVQPPAGATNWHGRYATEISKDPWGQDYVYAFPGKHAASGYPYDLFSPGPPGGNTPIANWDNPTMKP